MMLNKGGWRGNVESKKGDPSPMSSAECQREKDRSRWLEREMREPIVVVLGEFGPCEGERRNVKLVNVPWEQEACMNKE